MHVAQDYCFFTKSRMELWLNSEVKGISLLDRNLLLIDADAAF
jgi:hypothetical protein